MEHYISRPKKNLFNIRDVRSNSYDVSRNQIAAGYSEGTIKEENIPKFGAGVEGYIRLRKAAENLTSDQEMKLREELFSRMNTYAYHEKLVNYKYSKFKEQYTGRDYKDISLARILMGRYDKEERRLMTEAYLKEIDGIYNDKTLNRSQKNVKLEELSTLGRAITGARGLDVFNEIEDMRGQRSHIADTNKDYQSRYENSYDDEISQDEAEIGTHVRGYPGECYASAIQLSEGALIHKQSWGKRPEGVGPDIAAQIPEWVEKGIIDSEAIPFTIDPESGSKEFLQVKPLYKSEIWYNQLQAVAAKAEFDMSTFKPQYIEDERVKNAEALRILRPFSKKGQRVEFKEGDLAYYATLAARANRGPFFLLAQHFPEYKVGRIEVNRLGEPENDPDDYDHFFDLIGYRIVRHDASQM